MSTPKKRRQGWFIESEAAPESAPNLYAFVHAGGRADRFPDWQSELGDKARIVGMCPRVPATASPSPDSARWPSWRHPPPPRSPKPIAALFPLRPQPRRRGGLRDRTPPPGTSRGAGGVGLRWTAAPAVETGGPARLLPTEAFAEEVRFFGGIPPELESGSEAATLLLERLRLDFEMVASYEFRPTVALDVPVVCVVGDEDPHVDREGAGRWQDVTVRPLERHELPGGHFYFEDDSRALTALLRETTGREHPKPETHIELI
ncbi:alpha/beta fold hydrolase [Glycomyces albus]